MASEDNPNDIDRQRTETENPREPIRRPFDTSNVNWAPDIKAEDPPYQDWWVVSEEKEDE